MASSPPAYSPPHSHMSLPMKRPSTTLPPNPQPNKRRKGSVTSTSAHPLRQTSFPPIDRQQPGAVYSPVSGRSARSDSLDVDDEIASAVGSTSAGGPSNADSVRLRGTKKERGGKKAGRGRVGRPPKSGTRADTSSLIDGDTSTVASGRRGGGGGASTHGGQGGGGADDDAVGDGGSSGDEDDAAADEAALEGGKLNRAQVNADKERKALFVSAMPPHHATRYELWNRIILRKDIVRKLTNQTLSQSVPASVVTTINSYTKVFVGEIVDRAREVQREWVAAAELLPTGEKNVQGFAEGEAKVRERDCGPLLPDHLREALRRYKMDREGGTVGYTGLSLEGRDTAAVRSGGRRLFR